MDMLTLVVMLGVVAILLRGVMLLIDWNAHVAKQEGRGDFEAPCRDDGSLEWWE